MKKVHSTRERAQMLVLGRCGPRRWVAKKIHSTRRRWLAEKNNDAQERAILLILLDCSRETLISLRVVADHLCKQLLDGARTLDTEFGTVMSWNQSGAETFKGVLRD